MVGKITKKTLKYTFFRGKIWQNETFAVILHPQIAKGSLRLSVRTRDFHSLKRSSTLLGTTIFKSAIRAAMRYHAEGLGQGDGGFFLNGQDPRSEKYPPKAAVESVRPISFKH
jgi:hypothetical protein